MRAAALQLLRNTGKDYQHTYCKNATIRRELSSFSLTGVSFYRAQATYTAIFNLRTIQNYTRRLINSLSIFCIRVSGKPRL